MNKFEDGEIKMSRFNKIRNIALISVLACSLFTGCLDELLSSGGGGIFNDSLTTDEVVQGLKEALKVGVDNATDSVGQKDGYFNHEIIKILLPDSVNTALGYVQEFGSFVDGYASTNPFTQAAFDLLMTAMDFDYKSFLDMEGALISAINKAAEVAASDTNIIPIFFGAITDMTFTQAWDILNNEDSTAATSYFKGKTINPLTDAYSPYLTNALNSVGANALWVEFSSTYATFVSAYNSNINSFSTFGFEFSEPLEPLPINLGPYATEKAISGLFYMVGQEEARIRNDPIARITDILEKVFKTLDQ